MAFSRTREHGQFCPVCFARTRKRARAIMRARLGLAAEFAAISFAVAAVGRSSRIIL